MTFWYNHNFYQATETGIQWSLLGHLPTVAEERHLWLKYHKLQGAGSPYHSKRSRDSYTSLHYSPAVPNLGKQHFSQAQPPAQPPEGFRNPVISPHPEYTAQL